MAEEGVLFFLEAGNDLAQKIIDLKENASYRLEIGGHGVLKVGLDITPKVSGRLISLGRDPAYNDLILPDRSFSKNQCHFYFNPSSSALILCDTSAVKNTQISYFGLNDDSIYQLQGEPRRRVLLTSEPIDLQIGHAQFRITWQAPTDLSTLQALEQAVKVFAQKKVAPELELTYLDKQSLPSTRYELRSHYTPSVTPKYQKLPNIVHDVARLLGRGAFGTVHRTTDLDTGNQFAVKTSIHDLDGTYKMSLKHEVEILAQLSHPSIVKFMHSQGWTIGARVEIFMSLHKGTLLSLVSPHKCDSGLQKEPDFCTPLVTQMLHAIAYLHEKGIIHRDIKPENILYDYKGQNSSLAFYISDFGLSKQSSSSSFAIAGSPIYMAPEINQGHSYTSKCDIWSFAVTMLVVLGYFCSEEVELPPEKWKNRMALLPGYYPNLTFESDQGPAVSFSTWKCQLQWYGRLRALVHHKIVPELLRPLLAEDGESRLDVQQCLSSFFPQQYNMQPATPLQPLQPPQPPQPHPQSLAPLPILRTSMFLPVTNLVQQS